MKPYMIATSSTADLPRTWLDAHHIPFISYSFTRNGELCQDDCREESRAAIFQGMRNGDDLKTSMINEQTYVDFYQEQLDTLVESVVAKTDFTEEEMAEKIMSDFYVRAPLAVEKKVVDGVVEDMGILF